MLTEFSYWGDGGESPNQVMLILILIDVQYLQNAVFGFEKGSNGQNYSSSGPQHHIN